MLPARSEGSTCCCASTAPLPPHLIYAAPHFLLISMPLSPLPIFFFPLCCLCIALLPGFFSSLLLAGLPVVPESCNIWGFLLVCTQSGL